MEGYWGRAGGRCSPSTRLTGSSLQLNKGENISQSNLLSLGSITFVDAASKRKLIKKYLGRFCQDYQDYGPMRTSVISSCTAPRAWRLSTQWWLTGSQMSNLLSSSLKQNFCSFILRHSLKRMTFLYYNLFNRFRKLHRLIIFLTGIDWTWCLFL